MAYGMVLGDRRQNRKLTRRMLLPEWCENKFPLSDRCNLYKDIQGLLNIRKNQVQKHNYYRRVFKRYFDIFNLFSIVEFAF